MSRAQRTHSAIHKFATITPPRENSWGIWKPIQEITNPPESAQKSEEITTTPLAPRLNTIQNTVELEATKENLSSNEQCEFKLAQQSTNEVAKSPKHETSLSGVDQLPTPIKESCDHPNIIQSSPKTVCAEVSSIHKPTLRSSKQTAKSEKNRGGNQIGDGTDSRTKNSVQSTSRAPQLQRDLGLGLGKGLGTPGKSPQSSTSQEHVPDKPVVDVSRMFDSMNITPKKMSTPKSDLWPSPRTSLIGPSPAKSRTSAAKRNLRSSLTPRKDRQLQTIPSFYDILTAVGQTSTLPWPVLKAKKLAEASFSEVFTNQNNHVIKIIPFDCTQLDHIWAELQIAKEVSLFEKGFCKLISSAIVVGKYPANLLEEWEYWSHHHETFNVNPASYTTGQHYLLITQTHGGRPFSLQTQLREPQLKSIILQMISALSHLSHRDAHEDNVLISPCLDSHITLPLGSIRSAGLEVRLIDFTYSRLVCSNGELVYREMLDVFDGHGLAQYDVYRDMLAITGGDWRPEWPGLDIFWISLLFDQGSALLPSAGGWSECCRDIISDFVEMRKSGIDFSMNQVWDAIIAL